MKLQPFYPDSAVVAFSIAGQAVTEGPGQTQNTVV
jgi:hypothetical protein|tara:strand:- start:610 stop:714 length:105 start_codon:yes stop_codon:yes gene_type:complete